MKIEPISNNLIILTSNNGTVISVSDDGDYISIQRKIDVYHSTTKIKGNIIDHIKHFNDEPEVRFDCDALRITK